MAGASDVSREGTITLSFSEEIDAATATTDVVTLETFAGTQPISVAVNGTQLIITPAARLLPETIYTVSVGTGLRSRDADALAAVATAKFTTGGTWKSTAYIGNDETLTIYNSQIATVGDNGAVAVWSQSDGSRWHVMSNRYTQTGGWGVAEEIEALEGSADPYSAQVVADADGNAIVAWIQQTTGSERHVAANVLTAGVGWGDAELIADVDYTEAPRLAISANGSALVVWGGLWARSYVFGSGWGGAEAINNTGIPCADEYDASPSEECLTQVAMSDDGEAVAVWRVWDGAKFQIRANRFVPGEGWGSEQVLSGASGTDPRVAVDAAGNYLAIWREGMDSRDRVWSARYAPSSGWGGAQQLTDSTNLCHSDALHGFGSACTPLLAMNAGGDAVVVWNQRLPDNKLWTRRYTAAAGWAAAEALDPSDSNIVGVGVDPAGNAILLSRAGSLLDGYKLSSRRYIAGGNWGTSESVNASFGDSLYVSPLSIDALGNAMVIFGRGRSYRFE